MTHCGLAPDAMHTYFTIQKMYICIHIDVITTLSENVYFKSMDWVLIYLLCNIMCEHWKVKPRKYNEYTTLARYPFLHWETILSYSKTSSLDDNGFFFSVCHNNCITQTIVYSKKKTTFSSTSDKRIIEICFYKVKIR